MKKKKVNSHRQNKAVPSTAHASPHDDSAAYSNPGTELLRRMLLGGITALMVARPLVLGEDPGLSSRLSDTSSMFLSVLWLFAAVGWATWRAWSGNGTWYGGWIEAGLLVVIAIVFGSALWTASYRHPAILIAWEWLILFIVFSVVRQLARSPADSRRLLAAVLASGVSISAYAIYQYAVEMPDLRTFQAEATSAERQRLFETGDDLEDFDRSKAAETKRVAENNVYGTFAHPNSFAGFLALLLPAAALAAQLCWRRQRWTTHTILVVLALAVLLSALWLTHSRGAILAIALVGIVAACVAALRYVHSPRAISTAALGVLMSIGVSGAAGTPALEAVRQSIDKRLYYWSATWRMLTDSIRHFWLGVGPGQFSRYYPRYMSETAHEYIIDPHNFVLEMWAATGAIGMLALLATLALLLWKLLAKNGTAAAEPDGGGFATRWEFYFGGMAGLILGFLLSSIPPTNDPASQAEFLLRGIVAGVRAVIWFAAFAVFEMVPWTPRAMRLAIAGGIIALLLNLCVSAGIALPSVAQPMWCLAALGINTLPVQRRWTSRSWVAIVLPLPFLIAVCIYYVVGIYVPVSQSTNALHAASQSYRAWTAELDPQWKQSLKEGVDPAQRLAVVNRNKQFVDRVILPRLLSAHHYDMGNIVPLVDLATWYGEKWKLAPDIAVRGTAAGFAELATQLDPEGREAYYAKHQLNDLFGIYADSGRGKFLDLAADALSEVVKRDPTSATLRYKFADSLIRAERMAEGRLQAEQALRLDALFVDPIRKLTAAERNRAKQWVSGNRN